MASFISQTGGAAMDIVAKAKAKVIELESLDPFRDVELINLIQSLIDEVEVYRAHHAYIASIIESEGKYIP